MTTERNLDLFKFLDKINKKSKTGYRDLTEEEQKEFVPLVVMRWLSGTKNSGQIIFLNEVVNPFVFDLAKHKELLYRLMTVCTSGSFQRYTWQKAKGKSQPSMPISLSIVERNNPYLSRREALETLKIFSESDVLLMAEELGCEKEELTKVKAEFKKLKS